MQSLHGPPTDPLAVPISIDRKGPGKTNPGAMDGKVAFAGESSFVLLVAQPPPRVSVRQLGAFSAKDS